MKSQNILLVDDSDMVLRLTGSLLKKAGYNVINGANGKEGLAKLDGQEIDLLITDLNMPEMDGIELIQSMRKMPYYRFLPAILFMSAPYNDVEEVIRTSTATVLFDKDVIKNKMASTVSKLLI
jgi:two-component system chemotaxis response regulator CheY